MLFAVKIKQEFFDEQITRRTAEHLKPDTVYEVLAYGSTFLLVRGEDNQLVEVYPRWCLYVDADGRIIQDRSKKP